MILFIVLLLLIGGCSSPMEQDKPCIEHELLAVKQREYINPRGMGSRMSDAYIERTVLIEVCKERAKE